MEEENTTAPPVAIASIVVGMAFMAVSSGVMFAYIPLRLSGLGFAPWVSGTMITALAIGGFVGCLITGPLIRVSGHARIFATLIAGVILSFVLIALFENVWIWLGARFFYGLSVNGLFIVAQSWLHNSASDQWRGRSMAVFYMSYVLSLGGGSYLITFVDISTQAPMLMAIVFATLAIFPIGLTRLPQPPAPPVGSVSIPRVWKIAPVGLIGMMTVGGLTMMIQGFGPIWATENGFAKNDVALIMSMMQVGMLFVQLPLGALSDRFDRRLILLTVAVIISAAALFTLLSPGPGLTLVMVILIFAVWSGAVETIYSVSSALANDQANPDDYVMLSSTMLFAWSISAFVIPFIGTVATSQFGTTAFMWISIGFAVLFGIFVIVRMFVRRHDPEEDTETFIPASAQVPYQIEPFEAEEFPAEFWTDSVG